MLSYTASNALILSGRDVVIDETAKFVDMMKNSFDFFNVSNPDLGEQKRNDYLKPWVKNDFRVKVSACILPGCVTL